MELKDIVSLIISLIALMGSFAAIYLSHWHKSSKAILCLNSCLFDCNKEETHRELSYTLSNIGNQELYVKEILLLNGQSPKGNLQCDYSYLSIPTNNIKPFVIKPGEIQPFKLSHNIKYELPRGYDKKLNKYTLVSLEIISATGKRFQMTHDISNLEPSGPEIKDKIWQGVNLGKRI